MESGTRNGESTAEAPEVSVVLPAYNEAATIETTVATTLGTLSDFLPPGGFELIVAEDGCEDRTPAIASRLATADDRVRHVHSDDRLGRGSALEEAFRAARGGTLVYFDTDLATDMRHLEELIESVRTGEYDAATGSRWMPGREADRPAKRSVASRGFNGLVRLFLRSDLRDHQCGFKAFDRDALFSLLDDVEDDHWFWDTEVLVRAQRAGYDIREFPVDWTPKADTKVDLVRDVFGMGGQIVRTWWQLSVDPRLTRRVRVAAGVLMTVVALGLMTLYLDPSEVVTTLSRGDPVMLAFAAIVYVLSWPLRGLRYRTILRKLGFSGSLGVLTGAIFISQTGNLVFPARAGDAVRAYVVNKRRAVPYPSGFASLAIERVFDLLTITALAGVVLLAIVVAGDTSAVTDAVAASGRAGRTALLVAGSVALLAVLVTAAIVLTARSEHNFVRDTVARLSTDRYADRLSGVLERFAGDVQRVAGSPLAFGRISATSVAIWSIDVLTAVVVLVAVGVDVSLPTVVAVSFFAVSLGNLAKVLPLSPGGIGLYEAAFTLLVVGLTPIAAPTAFGAAVLDHLVKNVVTTVGGVASMALLNVSLTEAADEGTDAPSVSPSATESVSRQD